MRKCTLFLLLIVAVTLFNGRQAGAAGECGLSCCIAGAASSGVTLAENFGLSLAYEYMHMETIRNGTRSVSPDGAIAENQQMSQSYSVPTEMRMQKISLVGVLPVTERLQLMAAVPYIINDMDMRRRSAMGMTMDMTMDTVSGIGDISFMGLYTLYTDAPIRPGHRLVAGLGIKTPTGATSERTASGNLVHAMMQPGSGSWDPLFLLSYTRGLYPLVLQANLFHQLTTEGNNGYEFGDKTTLDLIARYQASNYINVGLELNGIHAERDRDHEGRYSRPVTSMADNPDFTGLDSVFITPAVQAKIPKTGGSAEIKYQVPVYQRVNGFQQVIDWRLFATLVWVF
ncbi:MAG: hypothetical protein QY316_12555 [Thermodesulfobacteriota bacterium]|nr:MAG: hypothetical protein QY316_12555 [Thermodesulfobacteriota bacterium]